MLLPEDLACTSQGQIHFTPMILGMQMLSGMRGPDVHHFVLEPHRGNTSVAPRIPGSQARSSFQVTRRILRTVSVVTFFCVIASRFNS